MIHETHDLANRLVPQIAGHNLQTATIGVFDEINAIAAEFVAHAIHFIMQKTRRIDVVDCKRQMSIIAPVVVRFGATAFPHELKLEIGGVVSYVDNLARAFRASNLANNVESKCAFVERERFFQIEHVNAPVNHFRLHGKPFSRNSHQPPLRLMSNCYRLYPISHAENAQTGIFIRERRASPRSAAAHSYNSAAVGFASEGTLDP